MVDPVETERLVLRPMVPADVDLLTELDGDPVVMRYITGGRPTSRDDVEQIVRRSLGHRWIAAERASAELVGWFGLAPTDGVEDERELGYRLRRQAWGRGYATEGSRAMLAMGFTTMDARRIWAQTMTVNTRSRRVLERCGLRYVRMFHADWPEVIEGSDHGDVVYEILRAEWAGGLLSPPPDTSA
jgi:RimJ/RimL family protein N-acetyltransferase